jgi:alpha-tubulin suppressor-like RCC1 family protein
VLVEGLEDVRGVAADAHGTYAVTQSGAVLAWGAASQAFLSLRPTLLEGLDGVRVRQVCAEGSTKFAIGEAGEIFSWGIGPRGFLSHGDTENLRSPKRVEAMRGVRVSSISVGAYQALALSEDGLVYAWGGRMFTYPLGHVDVEGELRPKPMEVLRCVRVGSIPPPSIVATRWRARARCGRGTVTR